MSAEVLATTATASCRCETMGLEPGITMGELKALGAGCTSPAFVCPRLDKVRRTYERSGS